GTSAAGRLDGHPASGTRGAVATRGRSMTSVVVDASFAVKWMLKEQWTAEATDLLRAWTKDGILTVAPAWFVCEVSNVLFQRLRDHQIRLADAQDNLRDLTRLVVIRTFDPALPPRAIELAQGLGLSKT